MNPLHHPRRPTLFWAATAALALPLAGCSGLRPAAFGSAAKTVLQDATSPAGRRLLADVTVAALRVDLDLDAVATHRPSPAPIQP